MYTQICVYIYVCVYRDVCIIQPTVHGLGAVSSLIADGMLMLDSCLLESRATCHHHQCRVLCLLACCLQQALSPTIIYSVGEFGHHHPSNYNIITINSSNIVQAVQR